MLEITDVLSIGFIRNIWVHTSTGPFYSPIGPLSTRIKPGPRRCWCESGNRIIYWMEMYEVDTVDTDPVKVGGSARLSRWHTSIEPFQFSRYDCTPQH